MRQARLVGLLAHGPVVLEVVAAPFRELADVLHVEHVLLDAPACFARRVAVPFAVGRVGRTARQVLVRRPPRRRVDAGLQALGVHLVEEALHVAELRVGLEGVAHAAALALPAVVEVAVGVTVVDESLVNERSERFAHIRLVHHRPAAESAERVESHRRRERDEVAHDEPEPLGRRALRVPRRELDHVRAARRGGTAENAFRGVERNARRQTLRLQRERTCSRDRQAVDNRRTGPHAVDRRPVDARRLPGCRRARADGHNSHDPCPVHHTRSFCRLTEEVLSETSSTSSGEIATSTAEPRISTLRQIVAFAPSRLTYPSVPRIGPYFTRT